MRRQPKIIREEIGRYKCAGDDETPLVVVEYRFVELYELAGKTRRRLGSSHVALDSGEALETIDARTFEVIATGEMIRRLD